MAYTTVTVSGRTTIPLTSATNTVQLPSGVTVLTKPSIAGIYALHDCASVQAAEIFNCQWPVNFDSPAAGNPPNTALAFNAGITVMTPTGDAGSLGSYANHFQLQDGHVGLTVWIAAAKPRPVVWRNRWSWHVGRDRQRSSTGLGGMRRGGPQPNANPTIGGAQPAVGPMAGGGAGPPVLPTLPWHQKHGWRWRRWREPRRLRSAGAADPSAGGDGRLPGRCGAPGRPGQGGGTISQAQLQAVLQALGPRLGAGAGGTAPGVSGLAAPTLGPTAQAGTPPT